MREIDSYFFNIYTAAAASLCFTYIFLLPSSLGINDTVGEYGVIPLAFPTYRPQAQFHLAHVRLWRSRRVGGLCRTSRTILW